MLLELMLMRSREHSHQPCHLDVNHCWWLVEEQHLDKRWWDLHRQGIVTLGIHLMRVVRQWELHEAVNNQVSTSWSCLNQTICQSKRQCINGMQRKTKSKQRAWRKNWSRKLKRLKRKHNRTKMAIRSLKAQTNLSQRQKKLLKMSLKSLKRLLLPPNDTTTVTIKFYSKYFCVQFNI